MTKKKKTTSTKGNIITTVTYGTGALCRKVTQLSKIAETKPFQQVVSGTGEFCKTLTGKTKDVLVKGGKALKKNVAAMQESFKEGMASVADPEVKSKSAAEPCPVCAEAQPEAHVEQDAAIQVVPAAPREEIKPKGKGKRKARGTAKKVKEENRDESAPTEIQAHATAEDKNNA